MPAGDPDGTGGLSLAVTGATGRMGGEVLAEAGSRGHEVPVAVSPSGGDREVEGVPVEPAGELPRLLDDRRPDVLVDFTAPAAAVEAVECCARAGVPAVVGTTGLDDDQAAALRAAAEAVPVLRAPNFARGVLALARAVEAAVRALPGYDVEVTETHHDGKRDAPSGTALALLDRVDDAREEAGERVHGREGVAPRAPGEVGVHARRAGDVTGEHEVLLAGNHEVLSLAHRAGSRGVFAAGALDAAEWLVGRPPGRYRFEEVVA